MRSLFFSSRLERGHGVDAFRYGAMLGMLALVLGHNLRNVLGLMFDETASHRVSVELLALFMALAFWRLLNFSFKNSLLISIGMALALVADYTHTDPPTFWWTALILVALWLMTRFFSEGPEPNGWVSLP